MDIAEKVNVNISEEFNISEEVEMSDECYLRMSAIALRRYGSFDEFAKIFEPSFIQQLRRENEQESEETYLDINNPLYGRYCTFSNKLDMVKRKDAMQIVTDLGGNSDTSVTQDTNYLIIGCNEYKEGLSNGKSAKWKKAEKLLRDGQDIMILPESAFYDMIGDAIPQ